MEYIQFLLAFISFIFLCYAFRSKNGVPTNWPIVGMLLPLLTNINRVHDWLIQVLESCQLNFFFKGPWFTDMLFLVTADPSNIHYIFSKNFANYPKGAKFNEMLDVLGDGIFNVDFDLWKYHRNMAHTFIGHPWVRQFLLEKVEEKIVRGLIPVLDHACNNMLVVDLQDLFERFTFDTTSTALSWFFYLITKNPKVESKIRKELDSKTTINNNLNNLNELVYLHGSLCEALRLYPPVVFEAKAPTRLDTLPSGHIVSPNMQVLVDMYAMARMNLIWGDDCYEFKPERWISKRGTIRHVPSYKFLSFNAGPRNCLGKEMAFIQMKAVAATIIKNYTFQALEGHLVVPDISIILRMKYGLKVRVYRS